MKKLSGSNIKIPHDPSLIFLVFAGFLFFIFLAIRKFGTLFSPWYVFATTLFFIGMISWLAPIREKFKVRFSDFLKIGLAFMAFISTAAAFILNVGSGLFDSVDPNKLSVSITLTFILIFASMFFSYLSDNSPTKKERSNYYRAFLFCLFFFCDFVSYGNQRPTKIGCFKSKRCICDSCNTKFVKNASS